MVTRTLWTRRYDIECEAVYQFEPLADEAGAWVYQMHASVLIEDVRGRITRVCLHAESCELSEAATQVAGQLAVLERQLATPKAVYIGGHLIPFV